MTYSVPLDDARTACLDSIDAVVAAVDGFSELDLLGASRCHGWSRLDVVAHLAAGLQEMLGGLVSAVDEVPTVDAASYWPAYADDVSDEDPVDVLMSQKRTTMSFTRPSSAVARFDDVAAAVRRGVVLLDDRPRFWQEHVFTAGDFLTAWAVENVIHHLDLIADTPAPSSALRLARETITELVGEPLPAGWDDETAVLVGTGRTPVPDDGSHLTDRLPALG